MYYVYFLESQKNGRYYVGITDNIQRRLKEHNLGLARSTTPYKPWVLRRVEEFEDANTAYKRERFIKDKHSRKIIKKIIAS